MATRKPLETEAPTLVDPNDLTVFVRFKDDSKAKMVKGVGWRPYDPWHARDILAPDNGVDYFTESMAAKFCSCYKEMMPDAEYIGICSA